MSKKARKALSLLLSLVLLLGLCVPSAFAAEGTYSDTQGHWAEEAIERWSEYGIVEGNNGRFNPNASLTRAQMAKVLANTLGLTEIAANPFSDVSESDWFAPYVLRCYAAGVMMGDNGKANPNATITRQQAMVMLCRALGIAPVKEPDLSAFTDSDKVGAWAAPYVAAMVESGIVGGIGNGQLAPGGNLSRAALMTILDRSIVQYINAPGTYELTDKDGIILVAAGKVTLTGKTPADILVTPAADGSTVTFDKATVTGSITVQADNAKITSKNSKLPEIAMTGEGSKVEESKPASGSSGGGGGSYVPSYSNLTVAESKTVSSGTYQNVTITDAVGDGEVTLQNLVINGDLTVQGGGSYSVKLESCVVRGRVIMAKTSGETPRLYLTNTPIAQVEAQQPAIIEAADAVSTVTAVEAKADVEVKGEQTTVTSMTVPATAEAPVSVTVSAGTVEKLEAKSDATVNAEGTVSAVTAEAPVTVASGSVETITVPAGITAPVAVSVSASASVATVEAKSATTVSAADNAVVGTVSAEAPVTVASGVVNTITVPDTAAEAVAIQVDSGAAVAEVAVSSTAGAAITNNGTVSAVSAANEEAQSNITASGSSATPAASSHIHSWDDGVETTAPTCTVTGVRTLTCTVDGCGTTKTESIAALGHNWDAGKVTTEPSCKTEGVKTYTCTACQTTKTETIAAIGGHVADSPWKTVKEATCTEAGARVRVCTRCSVEFLNSDAEGVIPALGHEYSSTWTSGGEDGHYHKCIRCSEHDMPAAHSFPANTNCAESAACTVCGYRKEAGQHTPGQWIITHGATCTADGSKKQDCTVCGQTVATGTIPALGHDFADTFTVDKESTCTVAGSQSKHCSRCDATTDVTVIPMIAHSFGGWTYKDENSHQAACSVCNTLQTENHTWNSGVVTKEPTETETGIRTYTCSVCKGTKTEDIPVVGAKNVWFTKSGSGQYITYYLNWIPVDLGAGETYYVNGTSCSNPKYAVFASYKLPFDVTNMDFTIETGTYNNKKTLYSVKDAVVVESLPEMEFTIAGETDGNYYVRHEGEANGTYYVRLKDADGTKYLEKDYTSNQVNFYPWDDCSVEVNVGSFAISEDETTLTFRSTPVKTITTFERKAISQEAQIVTSISELQAALQKGGIIELSAEGSFTGSATTDITVTGGAPATLRLNGKTLTLRTLEIQNGKELTVDGTVEGSRIDGKLLAQSGTKLTVNSGTYRQISASKARDISITNAEVACSDNTCIDVNNCKALTVTGGSYTCTSDTSSHYVLSADRCTAVRLENVIFSANGASAAQIGYADSVTVIGGSFTSASTSESAIYVYGAKTVNISGTQDNKLQIFGPKTALECYDNTNVTVSDVTAGAPESGSCSEFAVRISGGSYGVYTATLTRVTGIGGKQALEAASIENLTVDSCTFTADTTLSSTYGMRIGGRYSYENTKLDIKNTTASGHWGALISNYATVDVTGCTINSYDRESSSYQSICAQSCYKMTVSGGHMSGDISLENNSDKAIEYLLQGVILDGCLSVRGGSTSNAKSNATLEGCTFNGSGFNRGSMIWAGSYAYITVESGSYVGEAAYVLHSNSYDDCLITVHGGTFKNKLVADNVFQTGSDHYQIQGGTFGVDPTAFVDKSTGEHTVTKNETEGTWTVA